MYARCSFVISSINSSNADTYLTQQGSKLKKVW